MGKGLQRLQSHSHLCNCGKNAGIARHHCTWKPCRGESFRLAGAKYLTYGLRRVLPQRKSALDGDCLHTAHKSAYGFERESFNETIQLGGLFKRVHGL